MSEHPGAHIAREHNDCQDKNKGTLYPPAEEGDHNGRDHGQYGGRIIGEQQIFMALEHQGVHKVEKGVNDKGIGNHPFYVQEEKANNTQDGSNEGGAVIYLEYQCGLVL